MRKLFNEIETISVFGSTLGNPTRIDVSQYFACDVFGRPNRASNSAQLAHLIPLSPTCRICYIFLIVFVFGASSSGQGLPLRRTKHSLIPWHSKEP